MPLALEHALRPQQHIAITPFLHTLLKRGASRLLCGACGLLLLTNGSSRRPDQLALAVPLAIDKLAGVGLTVAGVLADTMELTLLPLSLIQPALSVYQHAGAMVKVLGPLAGVLLLTSPHTTSAAVAHVVTPLTVVSVNDLVATRGFNCQHPSTRALVLPPLSVVVEPLLGAHIDTRSVPDAVVELSVVSVPVREAVDAEALTRRLRPALRHRQPVAAQPAAAAIRLQRPALHEGQAVLREPAPHLPRRGLEAPHEVALRAGCKGRPRQEARPVGLEGCAARVHNRCPRGLAKQPGRFRCCGLFPTSLLSCRRLLRCRRRLLRWGRQCGA
mmetsp:Transcript_42379/g.117972  ORF Transcript_42379/g.117972 Transcript_42379/m.117972 type:complete len:330 (+) Transcript_42379:278-1267(+)